MNTEFWMMIGFFALGLFVGWMWGFLDGRNGR